MPDFTPGDWLLFRDGTGYGIARVDIVRDRHVTAFPYDIAQRRWLRRNRRIARGFIVGKIPHSVPLHKTAATIQRLHNEREAQRRLADTALEASIRQIAQHKEPA